MDKLSGLVLDQYDDLGGNVLRSIFPTEASVPDLIKEGQWLSPEDRQRLPSSSFALELVNNGHVMRKFACVDPANTALSVEYFLKTGHKLPIEAQKVAAQNLVTACGWYDIEPPQELQKVALGMGHLLTAAMAPSVVKGTKDQISRNMQVARASGPVVNPRGSAVQPVLG